MKKTITTIFLALATLFMFSNAAFANSCDYHASVKSYVGATVEITDFYYKYVDDPFAFWDPINLKSKTLYKSTDVYTESVTNITATCDSQDYALAIKYSCKYADGISRSYTKYTGKIQGGHTNDAYIIINECDAGLIYAEGGWPLVADAQASLSKQQLPVPGGGVSECLTLAQAGTILSNSVAGVGWQGDGNLVVYVNGSPIWATNTNGNADTLCFQGDGNLVTYKNGSPTWSTGTQNSGQFLNLQVDCNLVIHDSGNNYKWGSQATCGS